MEREQVIKALEIHSQKAMPCEECAYYSEHYCGSAMARDAISLIKELTEENDRLRYDTVRKMQERLTTFFNNDDNLKYNEVDATYINEMIDQIAEEIIGGSYGKKD